MPLTRRRRLLIPTGSCAPGSVWCGRGGRHAWVEDREHLKRPCADTAVSAKSQAHGSDASGSGQAAASTTAGQPVVVGITHLAAESAGAAAGSQAGDPLNLQRAQRVQSQGPAEPGNTHYCCMRTDQQRGKTHIPCAIHQASLLASPSSPSSAFCSNSAAAGGAAPCCCPSPPSSGPPPLLPQAPLLPAAASLSRGTRRRCTFLLSSEYTSSRSSQGAKPTLQWGAKWAELCLSGWAGSAGHSAAAHLSAPSTARDGPAPASDSCPR